ncbi:MAG: hypothetical protein WA954_09575 [Parerythrobacter sp.]
MSFIARFNPVPGLKDFWHEVRRPDTNRWPALLGACGLTFTLFYAFTQEGGIVLPAPPEVTYITTFDENRPDAEIVTSNIANQQRQDAIAERRTERERRSQDIYRALGNATGIDTVEMEREIAADRAREDAARAQREAELRAQAGLPAPTDLQQ